MKPQGGCLCESLRTRIVGRLCQTPPLGVSQKRPTMPTPKLTQPLVFEPIFMERVWGGRRLESLYGKRLPPAALIGESWEIVDRAEAQSVVHDGPLRGKTLHELWCNDRPEIFGEIPDCPSRTGISRFPILCKLLDAQENLSVQVHPPRAVAEKLGGEAKTEVWYVANAAPKARIYAGVKGGTTRQSFLKSVEQGTVENVLHPLETKTGDAIFLPSGRMHALGAGNVVVEIQENSDTTFRVYDWNRAGKGECRRETHIAEAMQCVEFTDVEPQLLDPDKEVLAAHDAFEVRKWNLTAPRSAKPEDRFAIIVCVSGAADCCGLRVAPGEFCLVPACLPDCVVSPDADETVVLQVTVPPAN